MTNRDRVIEFLRRVAPDEASNADILSGVGIKPHQQIFRITNQLVSEGLIRGRKLGKEWVFTWGGGPPPERFSMNPLKVEPTPKVLSGIYVTAIDFGRQAQVALSCHFGAALKAGEVPPVPKRFDLISRDRTIVGDAKFLHLAAACEFSFSLQEVNCRFCKVSLTEGPYPIRTDRQMNP
jgi:hypothetical protein